LAGSFSYRLGADAQGQTPEESTQHDRKRVRDALAEDGIGGEIEKLVEKLLGPA